MKRGRLANKINLTSGNDPNVWRYQSMQEAIKANLDCLAALIQKASETDKNMLVSKAESKSHSSGKKVLTR